MGPAFRKIIGQYTGAEEVGIRLETWGFQPVMEDRGEFIGVSSDCFAILPGGRRDINRKSFDFEAGEVEHPAGRAHDLDLVERASIVAMDYHVFVQILAYDLTDGSRIPGSYFDVQAVCLERVVNLHSLGSLPACDGG